MANNGGENEREKEEIFGCQKRALSKVWLPYNTRGKKSEKREVWEMKKWIIFVIALAVIFFFLGAAFAGDHGQGSGHQGGRHFSGGHNDPGFGGSRHFGHHFGGRDFHGEHFGGRHGHFRGGYSPGYFGNWSGWGYGYYGNYGYRSGYWIWKWNPYYGWIRIWIPSYWRY